MMLTRTHGGLLIDSARRLALAEHKDHIHNGLPYSVHLTVVAGMVAAYTMDADVIAAAWLHDIIEDCEDIDKEVVTKMTNRRVAHLVDLLTDPAGPRSLVKPISLKRIATEPDAILIKRADRWANHQATINGGSQKHATMYLSEFEAFMEAFAHVDHELESMLYAQTFLMGRMVPN